MSRKVLLTNTFQCVLLESKSFSLSLIDIWCSRKSEMISKENLEVWLKTLREMAFFRACGKKEL